MTRDDSLTPEVPEDQTAQYPLQLVATIAAQLLTGKDLKACRTSLTVSGQDYSEAAKRALDLIEACDDELACRPEERTLLTFREALSLITGQEREDRAFPLYRRFLRDEFFYQREVLRGAAWKPPYPEDKNPHSYAERVIIRQRREGVSLLEANHQRYQFKWWRAVTKSADAKARGKLGAKAGKQKL